ncbi:hypothetical protein BDP27DRAFT_1416952 [Rhodocollybia butyracea]|uniref:BBC1/AIM3 cysteine proteinase-fold domain-containing protein n=1 Tax=Rhodocollybia butyracea TaxID=206335 RepID=A0A9P5Q326_9AGAR|nr:hypothetical protein BDP27DRAFT_1416952 [Rhodocollybia butyracea]
MSDQPPPPPKSKPGSLRDRIAAFEKPTASNNAPPPLAPRPKAGQVSWKPKQATPPDSPAATDESPAPANPPKKASGGMSASDAKESIGKGGSLKERMAALQGRGAFGAPAPPVAPKPAIEKPKWKPPPRVASPPHEETEGEKSEEVLPVSKKKGKRKLIRRKKKDKGRATLAARMARLGGARVGMGPPVFGGPAYRKKSEPKVEDMPKDAVLEPKTEGPIVQSPPADSVKSDEETKQDYFEAPERKSSNASSLLSPESTSMPVPSVPRRAGPPRRKAKSPAPPPPDEDQDSVAPVEPTSGDREPEIGQVSIGADPVLETAETPAQVIEQPIMTDLLIDSAPEPSVTSPEPAVSVLVQETPIPTIKAEFPEPELTEVAPVVTQPVTEEAEDVQDEPEGDEAARRKRVAERLAKSGGVNPFAMQRKQSITAESVEETSVPSAPDSPVSQKRASIRRASTDSVPSSPPPPPRRSSQMSITSPPVLPTKKPSVDSIMSRDIISHDDSYDVGSPIPAGISEEPEFERSRAMEEADITEQKREDPQFEADDEDQPEEEDVPQEEPIRVPPPPPKVTTPSPPPVAEYESEEDEVPEPAPPPPPRRSIPPPPRMIPQPVEDEIEPEFHTQPELPPEPPRRLPRHQVFEDEGEMSDAPLPHPNRRSIPPPSLNRAEEVGEGEEDQLSDEDPKPIPASHRMRPPPQPAPEEHLEGEEDTAEVEAEEDELETAEEILPTPPRRARSQEEQPFMQDEPLIVPPPPPKAASTVASISRRRASEQVENTEPATPVASASDESQTIEILDEDDGDPIDPSFYSPPGRRASAATPVAPAPEPESNPVEDEVDEEQARRRTIAERMAKLGGLKFGAAPIPVPRPPPPPRHQEPEGEAPVEENSVEDAPDALNEEEEERARKERIAAKMATMAPSSRPRREISEDSQGHQAPAPSSRPPPRHVAPPPPPPPPQDIDSEHESLPTSDEGVRVEAEESEMEEVNYEDAVEEREEETGPPPPIPGREGREVRRISVQRPPVPTTTPSRKSSAQYSRTDDTLTSRKSSASHPPLPTSNSDYVMVEGSDDDESPPPPPPPRATRPSVPHPSAPSNIPPSESISSQWEMPSIPSVDFGANADLSLSWTDDMASSTSSAPPPPSAKSMNQAPPKPATNLTADDLVAVWGRVGVQVCENATKLYDQSKKALIGDGTYHGFIEATLRDVPNAAGISGQDYGYLVYMQSGASVQKRLSDIMPGDIVWMHDAKLKGHKGLQKL